MSTAGRLCAEIASERETSHAKRKTDQLHSSTSQNYLATPDSNKIHSSSQSCEKLRLEVAFIPDMTYSIEGERDW
jgi:hypothetical protein